MQSCGPLASHQRGTSDVWRRTTGARQNWQKRRGADRPDVKPVTAATMVATPPVMSAALMSSMGAVDGRAARASTRCFSAAIFAEPNCSVGEMARVSVRCVCPLPTQNCLN